MCMRQKAVVVSLCLHCAHLAIHLTPSLKANSLATLHKRYKDVTEHSHWSMTEQVQRERETGSSGRVTEGHK